MFEWKGCASWLGGYEKWKGTNFQRILEDAGKKLLTDKNSRKKNVPSQSGR